MIKHTLTLVSTFLLGAIATHATVVVKWGVDNDVVNNFYNSNRNSISASTATPVNPGANVNGYYNGTLTPTGRSAVFYGSVYNAEASNSRLQIANATPDYLIFDFAGTANNHTHAGLVFWQKSDGFLDANPFGFQDVSFDLVTGINAARVGQSVHLVVRQGASDFFVSNALGATVGGFGSKTYTQADVSSWSNYSPTTDIVAIGAAVTPALDDVTAIGFLFTSIDANLTTTAFRVQEFTVTAVPEPSTYALIAALGALGVVMLRRRKAMLK